jgi:hypothetical protein
MSKGFTETSHVEARIIRVQPTRVRATWLRGTRLRNSFDVSAEVLLHTLHSAHADFRIFLVCSTTGASNSLTEPLPRRLARDKRGFKFTSLPCCTLAASSTQMSFCIKEDTLKCRAPSGKGLVICLTIVLLFIMKGYNN